jgi:hypothetical protein
LTIGVITLFLENVDDFPRGSNVLLIRSGKRASSPYNNFPIGYLIYYPTGDFIVEAFSASFLIPVFIPDLTTDGTFYIC